MKKILLGLAVLSTVVFAEVNLTACYGCHGANFEKKALNKSLVVADMNATAITTALAGYKDGSYGGAMKGLMKAQLRNFPDNNATTDAIVATFVK